jgi:hypothetical protein
VYGLINDAMRRHVTETAGEHVWARVADRAGMPTTYAALTYYDDEVTVALLQAAAVELGRPVAELLRGFGTYWSARVGPDFYPDILGAAGTDVVSVLRNLDEMHGRVMLLYPELRPPSFTLVEGSAGTEVVYRSDRAGLEPFVIGLLEGLGELYGTPATVTHLRGSAEEGAVFGLELATA